MLLDSLLECDSGNGVVASLPQATSWTLPSAQTSGPTRRCPSTTVTATLKTPNPLQSSKSATWTPARRGADSWWLCRVAASASTLFYLFIVIVSFLRCSVLTVADRLASTFLNLARWHHSTRAPLLKLGAIGLPGSNTSVPIVVSLTSMRNIFIFWKKRRTIQLSACTRLHSDDLTDARVCASVRVGSLPKMEIKTQCDGSQIT